MENREIKISSPLEITVQNSFFNEIKSGTKTAEARPENYFTEPSFLGQKIIFKNGNQIIKAVITSVERFKNLDYLIKTENLKKLGSGITKENAKGIWQSLYPNWQGGNIVILNFKVLNENSGN